MKKTSKKAKVLTTNLGERSLNKQHNNRTIVIPKLALENLGYDITEDKMSANVVIVQEANGEKYIKVIPKKKGAKNIAAYITHGVFSDKAIARISKSPIKKLVVTDSIEPIQSIKNSTKINILSVANLLSEAIKRISSEKSVSVLFD